jgi:ribonuclease P protein component
MVRLRTTQDVERVRREGKAYPHPLVVVMVAGQPEPPGPTRAAVVAGRKVGSAVQRNRAKRLMREALRALPITPGHDLVLIARAGLPASTLTQVTEAVSRCLGPAGVLGAP